MSAAASLGGIRIALLETRRAEELANLVRRHGGEPWSVPAVREVDRPLSAEMAAVIRRLASGGSRVGIFYTGVGTERLLRAADELSVRAELLVALRAMTIVARGPKPTAVLRANAVPVSIAVPSPHTTAELIAALAPVPLEDVTVTVVHAGEPAPGVSDALRQRGAIVEELQQYDWVLSEPALEGLQQVARVTCLPRQNHSRSPTPCAQHSTDRS